MEYDDAIIQLGERVTKGLVTPGELLRDRVILEEYVPFIPEVCVLS